MQQVTEVQHDTLWDPSIASASAVGTTVAQDIHSSKQLVRVVQGSSFCRPEFVELKTKETTAPVLGGIRKTHGREMDLKEACCFASQQQSSHEPLVPARQQQKRNQGLTLAQLQLFRRKKHRLKFFAAVPKHIHEQRLVFQNKSPQEGHTKQQAHQQLEPEQPAHEGHTQHQHQQNQNRRPLSVVSPISVPAVAHELHHHQYHHQQQQKQTGSHLPKNMVTAQRLLQLMEAPLLAPNPTVGLADEFGASMSSCSSSAASSCTSGQLATVVDSGVPTSNKPQVPAAALQDSDAVVTAAAAMLLELARMVGKADPQH